MKGHIKECSAGRFAIVIDVSDTDGFKNDATERAIAAIQRASTKRKSESGDLSAQLGKKRTASGHKS